jgi:hypothetical protein
MQKPPLPFLDTYEISLLMTMLLNAEAMPKATLSTRSQTTVNSPFFEQSVRMATIDKLLELKYIEHPEALTVTPEGKRALKQTMELMGRFVNMLQVTQVLS